MKKLHEFNYGNGHFLMFDKKSVIDSNDDVKIVIINTEQGQVEFDFPNASIEAMMINHVLTHHEDIDFSWMSRGNENLHSYSIKHTINNKFHSFTFESTDSTGFTKKVTVTSKEVLNLN